jgi:hypothetical protein
MMFETRISADGATPAAAAEMIEPIRAMIERLADFTVAAQPAKAGFSPNLAMRYAAASPIARRRFDAILHETETIGTTGLRLIAGRNGKADPATMAAAQFLGNSLDTALRRLDELLPNRAA